LKDTRAIGGTEPLANGKHERSIAISAADESLYRSLVERIPGIFYIAEFGATAPWHFVSPQIENYLGLTPEEWLADPGNWLKHIHPDDRELVLAEEQRIVNTGTAFFAEYRMVSREGRVFWFRDESLVLRREDSRPPLLYGILYDITAQKEAEHAVRESEERLRLALEAANLGMWLWNPETDATLWDERECALYGLKPEQAPTTSAEFIEYVHTEDREWVRQAVREGFRTGKTCGVEYRVLWPDGTEHWLASAGRALRDATGKARMMRGITYDITSRRGLEEQLRRVQKMEAVGQLAGGIAHDFNNLLTIIHGHVELLSQRLAPGSADARDVGAIQKAADRAAAITGQLLAFGRKQVLQPRALDLRAVVAEIAALLRHLVGATVELQLELAHEALWVRADESQIEQVVLNLVVNARDAMPDGGKVTLGVDRFSADANAVRPRPGMPQGKYVRITVRDTGVGMDAETQARIFEPFFTTKALGKGTGLGLATVYGVVKQSGGWIWVDSAPGAGTTFEILFPEVSHATETPSVAKPSVSSARGHETVLLVDDEEDVRTVLRDSLAAQGYNVLCAGSGQEALALAAEHPGKVDVLITDTIMPGMDGPKLARSLRAARPETKVLYISGYTEDASLFGSGLLRSEAFLQKPFPLESLAQKVRALVSE
jgi:PAS domain S-box-containing protein